MCVLNEDTPGGTVDEPRSNSNRKYHLNKMFHLPNGIVILQLLLQIADDQNMHSTVFLLSVYFRSV